jgi:hypothetical protein
MEHTHQSRADITMPSSGIDPSLIGNQESQRTARRDRTLAESNGRWYPAIPLPLEVFFRKHCDCGRKFWTMEGYKGHYALQHIIRGR